jgi:hypothetical protein
MISEDEYRALEQETRHLVVARILKTTTSPVLRHLNHKLMSIDPTGKLLCAWYRQLREMMDHLITSKSAGQSDAEVSTAFDRELSLWFRKGPRRIIAEFDEQMKTEAFGLPAGT